jgi:metalloendopeptidase OMA1, mitochondrial
MNEAHRSFCRLSILLIPLVLVTGCYTVPETGRSTINFLPETMLSEQAAMAFDTMKQEAKVSTNPAKVQRVQRIGNRILAVALPGSSMPPLNQWEFRVFEDDATINAFAMPGGKVAVYTGIMILANKDDELAAIIGHEIAHVAARHGNERMSQSLMIAGGGLAVGYAVKDQDPTTQEAVLLAYGIGATLGAQLPYSRLHENEADEIGLIYMARAGYDPRAAITFWEKMKTKSGGEPPQFLSTHPNHGTRIERLNNSCPGRSPSMSACEPSVDGFPSALRTGIKVTGTGDGNAALPHPRRLLNAVA